MTTAKGSSKYEEDAELRRGPWTLEEDTLLIHYIACHGEGRWNLLARCSGLKRTGKSCRLRWLNYLKPDVKRGNLTPEEQILILELHSKWGNRWSRIAQHLPGRTDNEIKNYWRTRVQKQARQLKVDANSDLFRDAIRCFWMPRLIEKMGGVTAQPLAPPLPPTGGFEDMALVGNCTTWSSHLAGTTILPSDGLAGDGDTVYGIDQAALVGGGGYDPQGVVDGETTLVPLAGPAGSSGDSGSGCTMMEENWGDGLWSNHLEDQWLHDRRMNEWGM